MPSWSLDLSSYAWVRPWLGQAMLRWSPDWLSYALFGIHLGWAILGRSLGRVASDSGCWRLSAVDALLWLLLLVLLLVLLLMSTAGC